MHMMIMAYYKQQYISRRSTIMTTATRRIAIALSAALVASTAVTPMASAHDWQAPHREWHRDRPQGHTDGAAWIGLGIAALAGAVLIANANEPPQPAYAQPGPTCTTISGRGLSSGAAKRSETTRPASRFSPLRAFPGDLSEMA
jgi:hypothetical protein